MLGCPSFPSDLQFLGNIDPRSELFIFMAWAKSGHFVRMGENARVGEVAKHAWGTLGERLLLKVVREQAAEIIIAKQ